MLLQAAVIIWGCVVLLSVSQLAKQYGNEVLILMHLLSEYVRHSIFVTSTSNKKLFTFIAQNKKIFIQNQFTTLLKL